MKKHFLLLAMALMTSVVSFAQKNLVLEPEGGDNVTVEAYGSDWESSSTENPKAGLGPWHVIDGEKSQGGNWWCNYGKNGVQGHVGVKWSVEQSFNTVKIYFGNDMNVAFSFDIETSNDGTVWTKQGETISSTGVKQGEFINVILKEEVKAKYVRFHGVSATNINNGFYKIAEIEVYNVDYKNQVLTSLSSSISFIHAGTADTDALDITLNALDQDGMSIEGLTYTVDNNAKIENGKLKAPNAGLITITTTYNDVTMSCYVYAVDGSLTPTHDDVAQMIYPAENIVWQTGWNGGCTKGNEFTLKEGVTGQVFRNLKELFFGINGDVMDLSVDNGWGSLSMDVCVAAPCTVSLYVGILGNDYQNVNTVNLKQGWQTIKVSLNGIGKIRTMSLKSDGNANVLVTNVYFSKADALAVEIDDYKYVTFSSKDAVQFGDDVTVYTAKVSDNSTVILTKVADNKVPANEGVIIYAENAGTYKANKLETTDVKFEDGINDLKISGSDITAEKTSNYYVLNVKNGNVGFYKLAEGSKIPAGRAYLEIDNASKAAMKMVIGGGSGDGSTGISNINAAENLNGAAYNLNGIRVNDSYKGIVIINGKKVIRK